MNINRKCSILFAILFLFIGITLPASAQKSNKAQTGKASWYGSKYHGKKTSSGERYNKNEMTAAHKTLPFGTKVKVTNLANNKTVIVRINDRGPFVGNRIIDVSEAAAKKLSIKADGIGKVKVEIVTPKEQPEIALVEKLPSIQTSIQEATSVPALDLHLSSLIKFKASEDLLPADIPAEGFDSATADNISTNHSDSNQQTFQAIFRRLLSAAIKPVHAIDRG